MLALKQELKHMYEPIFNSILVEIYDADAQWGSGNDDSMLGKSHTKGKVIRIGKLIETQAYPDVDDWIIENLNKLVGKNIIWNEGAEAGTTFEFDQKLFGFIYWYDIRGVKVDDAD